MTSTALKLKEHLPTNGSMTLCMKKRGKAYESKYKPGEMQTLYFFEADGKEYSYYANSREEESLKNYVPGDLVQVSRQEKVIEDGKRIAFQVWGTPGSAEMTAAPQLQTNTAIQRQERQSVDHQKAQKVKEVMISLAGLTQAYIAAGHANPLLAAVQMRDEIIAKAIELASK